MSQIVICEFMDQSVVDETAKNFSTHYDPELVNTAEELKAFLRTAKALIVRNRTQVNKDLLESAPNLKVVGRLGVGLDNIDLAECEKRGIKVCPATGANDVAVAEWVICSILMLFRNAFFARTDMLSGKWPRQQCMGKETQGKTLGLIGYGGIARETAGRARALGMHVFAFDPYLPEDSVNWLEVSRCEALSELLQKSDVISLHVPLTDSTHHLINVDTIHLMKDGAMVINAARGSVVDERALIDGLRSGKLGGAAFDVFETEPLTEEAAALFLQIPNLVLTPHIAGVTVESNTRVSKKTMENVFEVLEKEA